MSTELQLLAGTARGAKVSEVEVMQDEERVHQAAEVATTVIMQKFGDALGATREEVFDVNAIGLQVALAKAADGEAKVPHGIFVPAYFDSMIKGLTTKLGRTVVISSSGVDQVVLPGHYKVTVMKMKAAGITMVTPHKPSEDSSNTLALAKENIDDVECIVGNFKDVDLGDVVRRGLIRMSEKDLDTLRALTGELALNYGELDSLLTDYFTSATRVAVS